VQQGEEIKAWSNGIKNESRAEQVEYKDASQFGMKYFVCS
jgi:hypothetical protein